MTAPRATDRLRRYQGARWDEPARLVGARAGAGRPSGARAISRNGGA